MVLPIYQENIVQSYLVGENQVEEAREKGRYVDMVIGLEIRRFAVSAVLSCTVRTSQHSPALFKPRFTRDNRLNPAAELIVALIGYLASLGMIDGRRIKSKKRKSTYPPKKKPKIAQAGVCGTRTMDLKKKQNTKTNCGSTALWSDHVFCFLPWGQSSRWTTRPVKLVREEETVAVYIVTFEVFCCTD